MSQPQPRSSQAHESESMGPSEREGSPSSSKQRQKRRRPEDELDHPPESGPSSRPLIPRQFPRSPDTSRVSRSESGKERERGEGETEYLGSGALPGSPSNWTYELVVIQHPQRARACGFGDKDRRPLSPPPIIRLIVRRPSGDQVDPSQVHIQFLVLLVDLWSADATESRAIVMHPGSTNAPPPPPPLPPVRQSPPPSRTPSGTHASNPSSRPGTADSRPLTATGVGASSWQWNPQHSPISALSTGPSPLTRLAGSTQIPAPLPIPSPTFPHPSHLSPTRPANNRSTSYSNQPQPHIPDPPRPFTAPSPTPFRPPDPTSRATPQLPPLSTISEILSLPPPTRSTLPAIRSPLPSDANERDTGEGPSGTRPSWASESGQVPGLEYAHSRSSTSTWHGSSLSSADGRNRSIITGWQPDIHLLPPPSPSPWIKSPISAETFTMQQQGILSKQSPAAKAEPTDRPEQAYPGASFSRVLVGSLSATCQKLADQDGNPGLFFFAHDLGVRTEGTFRLKFSLTDLSALLRGGVSPAQHSSVLAETFSEPFTVYSAKRFPGVIPTTALTRLFAGQNVRLPTRQRRNQGAGDAGAEGEGDDDED